MNLNIESLSATLGTLLSIITVTVEPFYGTTASEA